MVGLGITLLLVNCAQIPSSVDEAPPPSEAAQQPEVQQPETQQSEMQQSEARQPGTQQPPTPSFQEFRAGLIAPTESRIVRPIAPRIPPESVVVEETIPVDASPLIDVMPSGAEEQRLADLIPEPEPEAQGWGSEEHYIEGLNHYNRGNYESAINSFDQALNLGAEDPALVYNQLGLAYHQQEQFDEAIEHYTAALEINDKYADVYLNRADVYFELGDSEKAAADYQRWEGLNSK